MKISNLRNNLFEFYKANRSEPPEDLIPQFSLIREATEAIGLPVVEMEGFEADKYDEILNLSEKGLEAAVVCAIGYRSEEDWTQHQTKVRKSKDDLFEVV